MSLIGFSLNYVCIKVNHIEFPLFKVSHYLHCTLPLLAIYFFFLYWACPLSNFMQVGEPNTPSCFRKHWECQSKAVASRGEDWTISCRPYVRRYSIFSNCFGQMVSILLYGYLITIFPNPTNIFCTHRTNAKGYSAVK